jgi:hypothetical protein
MSQEEKNKGIPPPLPAAQQQHYDPQYGTFQGVANYPPPLPPPQQPVIGFPQPVPPPGASAPPPPPYYAEGYQTVPGTCCKIRSFKLMFGPDHCLLAQIISMMGFFFYYSNPSFSFFMLPRLVFWVIYIYMLFDLDDR